MGNGFVGRIKKLGTQNGHAVYITTTNIYFMITIPIQDSKNKLCTFIFKILIKNIWMINVRACFVVPINEIARIKCTC